MSIQRCGFQKKKKPETHILLIKHVKEGKYSYLENEISCFKNSLFQTKFLNQLQNSSK